MKTTHRWLSLVSYIFAAVALASCSSAPVKPSVAKSDPAREHAVEKEKLENSKVIAPGFTLRIQHAADESITGEYKVSFKGEVKLPYKVKVVAAGKTPDELASDLERAYSKFFKAHNTVKVEIAVREYLIEIRGLVKKPGLYDVKLDTSIEEAISMAGGLTTSAGDSSTSAGAAKPEYLRIVRRDFNNPDAAPTIRWIRLADYFAKYDVRNDVLWHGGEQLFFQVTGDAAAIKSQGLTIQIMGEVRQPGEYAIQPGTDLHTYLTRAGGPTSTANLNEVTIIQKATNDSNTYDLTKSTTVVDLAPGDIILVKAVDNKPGFFERLGPLFISIGSLAVSILIAIATL